MPFYVPPSSWIISSSTISGENEIFCDMSIVGNVMTKQVRASSITFDGSSQNSDLAKKDLTKLIASCVKRTSKLFL